MECSLLVSLVAARSDIHSSMPNHYPEPSNLILNYLSQQFRDKGIVVFHVTYEQSESRL